MQEEFCLFKRLQVAEKLRLLVKEQGTYQGKDPFRNYIAREKFTHLALCIIYCNTSDPVCRAQIKYDLAWNSKVNAGFSHSQTALNGNMAMMREEILAGRREVSGNINVLQL